MVALVFVSQHIFALPLTEACKTKLKFKVQTLDMLIIMNFPKEPEHQVSSDKSKIVNHPPFSASSCFSKSHQKQPWGACPQTPLHYRGTWLFTALV